MSGVGVTLRSSANVAFQACLSGGVVGEVSAPGDRRSDEAAAQRSEVIVEVIEEKGAWLIELQTMPDHVHLLVEVDPQCGCIGW